MPEETNAWNTGGWMAVGFIAGALYPAAAMGLVQLWPNTFTFVLGMYSTLIMPFVFCAFYPLRLIARGATRHPTAILITAVFLGALSLFAGTLVGQAIFAIASNHAAQTHPR